MGDQWRRRWGWVVTISNDHETPVTSLQTIGSTLISLYQFGSQTLRQLLRHLSSSNPRRLRRLQFASLLGSSLFDRNGDRSLKWQERGEEDGVGDEGGRKKEEIGGRR